MFRIAILIFCSFLVFGLDAQLSEDFSDGNLSVAPEWSGDVDSFQVNQNGELQLNGNGSGIATIIAGVAFPDSVTWKVDFMTAFEPSNSNQFQILLMLDKADFSSASGYLLEVGSTGSPDPVCIYALDSGEMQLLNCSSGFFKPAIYYGLKVEYHNSGVWKVSLRDENGFYSLAIQLHEKIIPSDFSLFGLSCKYTTSRNRDFFFDNILIDRLLPDTLPPRILSVEISKPTEINIVCNELIDTSTQTTPIKLTGVPAISKLDISDRNIKVRLTDSLQSGKSYVLRVENIRDVNGNTLQDTLIPLLYWTTRTPAPGELLITEVLPDPTPPLGLPDSEYIELYNPTTHAITTRELTLFIDNISTVLPETTIPPGHYALLSKTNLSETSPEAIPITSDEMPTLKNSDGSIGLESAGVSIHEMRYSEDNYTTARLKPDGRSIEMRDIHQPCIIHDNWLASQHLSGGTPGKDNSYSVALDNTVPTTEYYFVSDDYKLISIHFDRLLSSHAPTEVIFTPPATISSVKIAGQVLTIETIEPLKPDHHYSISIRGLLDCKGREISQQLLGVMTPSLAPNTQAIINEILADPESGCPTFIEIMNHSSSQSINAHHLALTGNFGTIPFDIERTIPPGCIIAFSKSPETLRQYFPTHNKKSIHQYDIGTLDRNNNLIILHTSSGQVLDSASYNVEYHHPAISETKGVALERISPLINGNKRDAWQSASESSGWATPGTTNSQSFTHPVAFDDIFVLESEVFSPDGDGFEDLLIVHLSPSVAGRILNAQVLDFSGRLLRRVSEYILAGNNTLIVWNGTNEAGLVLRPGPYLLHIELIHNNGRSVHYKQPIVLAGWD